MKLWTESVAEEIRPLVTDEIEFQHRDESILLAFFANFGQPKIRCKNKMKHFPRESSSASVKLLLEILIEKNQASRYGER